MKLANVSDVLTLLSQAASDVRSGAVDPKKKVGLVVKTGIFKGQWMTDGGLGDGAKVTVRDTVETAKAGDPNPPVAAPKAQGPLIPPARRRTHDIAIHTASGTRVFRYEEFRPGEWRLVGEVAPGTPPARPRSPDRSARAT